MTLAAANPYRYAIGYLAPQTGYLNLGARYYNPATGRWRGLATRYDKLVIVYRAAAVLNAVIAWARHLSDTL